MNASRLFRPLVTMPAAALLAIVLALGSTVLGAVFVWTFSVPVPISDLVGVFKEMQDAGGWLGLPFYRLFDHHNEHRLVITRIAVLMDLVFWRGTQDLLFQIIFISIYVNATLLALLAWAVGLRGWLWAGVAAICFGVAITPVQYENLLNGFQVQFIQVWMFAIMAFGVLAAYPRELADPRRWVWRGLVLFTSALAAVAATYSMKNGLLVWPLLIVLAVWLRIGWIPAVVLAAVGGFFVWVEVTNLPAVLGHSDPSGALAQPFKLSVYAFRYLTSGVQMIGTLGQEILGGVTVAGMLVFAVRSLVNPGRFRPAHGVLLATAGFIIASAFATGLGRLDFGVGQASSARYATPSLLYLVTVTILALDLLRRRLKDRGRSWHGVAALGFAAVLLMVPSAVGTLKDWYKFAQSRDEKRDAVAAYLAYGYDPESLKALWPFRSHVPYKMLRDMAPRPRGPFVDISRVLPMVPWVGDRVVVPQLRCGGVVEQVDFDPVNGIRVSGWGAWPSEERDADGFSLLEEQLPFVLVTDEAGLVLAWGAHLRPAEGRLRDVLGYYARRFVARGPYKQVRPARLPVIGMSADRQRTCLIGKPENDFARFLTVLPPETMRVEGGPWRSETRYVSPLGKGPTMAQPTVATRQHPIVQTSVEFSGTLPEGTGTLALPIRTGAFPDKLAVWIAPEGGSEYRMIYKIGRPSRDWHWLVLPEATDLLGDARDFRLRLTLAPEQLTDRLDLGQPAWIPADAGG